MKNKIGLFLFGLSNLAALSGCDTSVTSNPFTQDASVTAETLSDSAVSTKKIADGSVTTAKIADQGITAGKLANNIINAQKIVDGAVGAAALADGSVSAAKLASDAVTTVKILDANVTAAKLASNSVTTAKILDANVTTAKIADVNVTTAKIADGAVTAAKILDANVTTTKIADANVTTAKLVDGSVTAVKILDSNVTTSKIAAGAVDSTKLSASLAKVAPATSQVITFSGATSTWQSQIDALPKYIPYGVTVTLQVPTGVSHVLSNSLAITGFYGGGTLALQGNTAQTVAYTTNPAITLRDTRLNFTSAAAGVLNLIQVYGNQVTVQILYLGIDYTSLADRYGVRGDTTSKLYISGCDFNGTDSSINWSGAIAAAHSNMHVIGSRFTNTFAAVWAYTNSRVHLAFNNANNGLADAVRPEYTVRVHDGGVVTCSQTTTPSCDATLMGYVAKSTTGGNKTLADNGGQIF